MIRAVSVAVPPGPVAVAVYVTDDVGLTCRDPVAVTSPTPGSIRTEPALVAVQSRVTGWPRSIVVGCARSTIPGAGGGGAG